jgi:NAD(P)-dependent dehydrogenase (short-subunit alcohol dehydrogenase family)
MAVDLSGQVAIVTGASSGIGAADHRAGLNVVVNYRENRDGAAKAAEECVALDAGTVWRSRFRRGRA